ncbi:cytochrome c family protein [bacterium]|nr:cytochrome c family protein [bacterium]
MKGKKIKIEILIGIALLLIIAGAAGMRLTPDKEPDRVLRNRFGDVTWNHELHARLKSISNCTTCHHTERQGAMDLQPCTNCHKLPNNLEAMINPELFMEVAKVKYEGEKGQPAMDAFHGKCVGCHKTVKEGPVICRDCHAQTFSGPMGVVKWDHRTHSRKLDMNDKEGLDGNCVACHHKDDKAETEADYRACATCHKPTGEKGMNLSTGLKDHKKAKHGECQSCHVEFNPEDKNIACVDCHKGMVVDTEKTKPSLEQAIHGKCGSCHNSEAVDLETKMPVYCADCHQPDQSVISIPGMKPIAWNHKRHGEFSEISCKDCHHTDHPEGPKLACDSCHGALGYEGILSLEKSLEKYCLDCHKKKDVGLTTLADMASDKAGSRFFKYQDKNGKFWWNHGLHAVDTSLSCQDCHHNTIKRDGNYVTALKAKKSWPKEAQAIQSCDNCHGPNGPVTGSVAQNTKAPSRSDVYETSCVKCHQSLGGGPQTWKDILTNTNAGQ